MKVSLFKNPNTYSSYMYFVRGDWNKIDDINTIIDPGINGFILSQIKDLSTGVGKSKIEQVILTHEHFDHAAGLKYILKEYSPQVYAFSKFDGVTNTITDGMEIQIGDEDVILLHTPGHSHDSICIYCKQSKALFSGDTPINIKSKNDTFTKEYFKTIEKLKHLDISAIYSGHDDPILVNANQIISNSFKIISNSKII